MHSDKNWYRLDNAGKLYPSIMTHVVTAFYRVSVNLTENVDVNTLEKALEKTLERYPMFKVKLHFGMFWFYFKRTDQLPEIEDEIFYPCMYKTKRSSRSRMMPLRVLYRENRISLEIFHGLTDGNGANRFLKHLVIEYFNLMGVRNKEIRAFLKDQSVEEEYEDAFSKYYSPYLPKKGHKGKAFKIPYTFDEEGKYNVITGIMEIDDMKLASKECGLTITEFLMAVYLETLQELFFSNLHESIRYRVSPIGLNVPIDLRAFFPSKTMRNFFITVVVPLDTRMGHYTFEEIAAMVKNSMAGFKSDKYLKSVISQNVKSERSLPIRMVPLILKNIMLPFVYYMRGERNYTSGFSNLGIVSFPDAIAEKVERVEFYPPPSKGNKIKIGVVSYGTKMFLSFGNLTTEKEIEKIYFRKLRKRGIAIKIETNERSE